MERKKYTLKKLAQLINARVEGDSNAEITGVSSIHAAKSGDVAFCANAKSKVDLSQTKASAVVLRSNYTSCCRTNRLLVDNPALSFIRLLELFHPRKKANPIIHPTVVIGKSCKIDTSVSIGAYTVLGDNVVIGRGTFIETGVRIGDSTQLGTDVYLHSQVNIYSHIKIGDRVEIHSGAVIGADGFGYEQNEQKHWIKIPQIGHVIIENDVEIGALTAIDRGALDDTLIETGVKIDNQVMIGHNVRVGAHTIIAGCVGIAGSSTIGKFCMIGGGSGINGHITLVDHVIITGMSRVLQSIDKPGVYSSGTNLQTNREWHKSIIRFPQLNTMEKRLKALEKSIKTDIQKTW